MHCLVLLSPQSSLDSELNVYVVADAARLPKGAYNATPRGGTH
jgi:hypothetical protein